VVNCQLNNPKMDFPVTCTTGYRFSFNGQEKTDEIYGEGNLNTALFWEYDTRLGRRWNLDPIPNAFVSNYNCFGNNPILFSDVLGNRWGKPGDAKQAEQDKAHADKQRGSFSKQEQQYKSEYNNLTIQAENFSGDKNSDSYKSIITKQQEAYVGMNDMKQAQEELLILQEDVNYYTFKMVSSSESSGVLEPNVTKNNDGTFTYEIPYVWGIQSVGTKAHEIKHAFQFSQRDLVPSFDKGRKTTSKFFQDQYKNERDAYIRQFYISPESMPFKVNSYRDVNSNYLKQFKTKDGLQVYDQIE
jgi:hypothetical protein